MFSDSLSKNLLQFNLFQFKAPEYHSRCHLLGPQDTQQEWSDHKQQNNRKWITEINAKHKSIKFLKDNRGENVDNPAYSDDFLDNTSEAQSMKEIIDKLNLIKI